MKLRIKENSMRFRVSRSEVARLLAADPLVETIQFAPEAGARFTYALQREASVKTLTVRYTENKVLVLLPADRADAWGATDQVGIAEDITLGEHGALTILIEKDFACLDRSDEDNEDTFANPNAGAQC